MTSKIAQVAIGEIGSALATITGIHSLMPEPNGWENGWNQLS
tara:strand:+ start:1501 stop:1626 length:126 start_codon:yes stop_codon:yes gene_type:complete